MGQDDKSASQSLYVLISYNCLIAHLELGLVDVPEFYIFFEKAISVKVTDVLSLITEFDVGAKIILHFISVFEKIVHEDKLKYLHYMICYIRKLVTLPAALKFYSQPVALERYTILIFHLAHVIKFYLNNNLFTHVNELISTMHSIWNENNKKNITDKFVDLFLAKKLDPLLLEIRQNQTFFFNYPDIAMNLKEIHDYCLIILTQSTVQNYHEIKETIQLNVNTPKIEYFTLKFKQQIESVQLKAHALLDIKTSNLQHELKNHIPVFKPHITLEDLRKNYLTAMTKIWEIKNLNDVNNQAVQKYFIQINDYIVDICSYLVDLWYGLRSLKSTKISINTAQKEILSLGLQIIEIISANSHDLPHYQNIFLALQIIGLMDDKFIEVDETIKNNLKIIVSLKCLNINSRNHQIQILFKICRVCIKKIENSSVNQSKLLAMMNTLIEKIVVTLGELKDETNASILIEIYISVMEKLSYIANFYFKKYLDSHKTSTGLLSNFHALIKRLLKQIYPFLQSMPLTIVDRCRILVHIFQFCSTQKSLLKHGEHKTLFSVIQIRHLFIVGQFLQESNYLALVHSLSELEKSLNPPLSVDNEKKIDFNNLASITYYSYSQQNCLNDQLIITQTKTENKSVEVEKTFAAQEYLEESPKQKESQMKPLVLAPEIKIIVNPSKECQASDHLKKEDKTSPVVSKGPKIQERQKKGSYHEKYFPACENIFIRSKAN